MSDLDSPKGETLLLRGRAFAIHGSDLHPISVLLGPSLPVLNLLGPSPPVPTLRLPACIQHHPTSPLPHRNPYHQADPPPLNHPRRTCLGSRPLHVLLPVGSRRLSARPSKNLPLAAANPISAPQAAVCIPHQHAQLLHQEHSRNATILATTLMFSFFFFPSGILSIDARCIV